MDWSALFDAHGRAQDAEDAVKALREAVAERDALVAQLAESGPSYADIAARLGVSRARVGQYVAAHKKRQGEKP